MDEDDTKYTVDLSKNNMFYTRIGIVVFFIISIAWTYGQSFRNNYY